MQRTLSAVLGTALSITSFITPLTFAQGIPPEEAQSTPRVERVGNQDFRPTRRILRERARGRQATDANTFLEYRLEHRAVQQQRTLENILPQQRRDRMLEKQEGSAETYMERMGERMMETHEKMAPRRAPGTRQGKNIESLPNSKRVAPGTTRVKPADDMCLAVIGTRRARCYYRLQRMTVPGS